MIIKIELKDTSRCYGCPCYFTDNYYSSNHYEFPQNHCWEYLCGKGYFHQYSGNVIGEEFYFRPKECIEENGK